MNEDIAKLAIELEADDPAERSRAATFAGNHGVDATILLPRLLEMVCRNLVLESAANRCGEYVSLGRILRAIQELKNQQLATDEMIRLSDPPQKLIDFVSSNGNKYRPASGAFLKEGSVFQRGTNRKAWMRWITIKRWISDTEVEIEGGVWCCPMGGGVMTSIYERIDGKWKWKAKGNGENWISCNKRRTNHCTQVAGRPRLTLETLLPASG